MIIYELQALRIHIRHLRHAVATTMCKRASQMLQQMLGESEAQLTDVKRSQQMKGPDRWPGAPMITWRSPLSRRRALAPAGEHSSMAGRLPFPLDRPFARRLDFHSLAVPCRVRARLRTAVMPGLDGKDSRLGFTGRLRWAAGPQRPLELQAMRVWRDCDCRVGLVR